MAQCGAELPSRDREGAVSPKPLSARCYTDWKALLICCALTALGDSVLRPIIFEEIVGRAGVHFKSDTSPTPLKHQPEKLLAGVAVFD
jgi:hypothetical protein